MALSDMQLKQFLRAEQEWLDEPHHDPESPRCACCGCANDDGYLYLYHDKPWCFDCLMYEGLHPDEIDELDVYDE